MKTLAASAGGLAYFDKVGERGASAQADGILPPAMTVDMWLQRRKAS